MRDCRTWCRTALNAALRYSRKNDIWYDCPECDADTLDDYDTDTIIDALEDMQKLRTDLATAQRERDEAREALRAVVQTLLDPTEAAQESAAMLFRHDYGLLEPYQQEAWMRMAKGWAYSWAKVMDLDATPPTASDSGR